ncbi:hypothetical protein EJ05DRAFT_508345 [Pseudovirgaria hyperparasitica]|uniref:Uncharacterized protein n=1 Tax=Pseudovirgaria hyperparasitica TaxID=470096 RepID=A0A6A6WE98_9PEZI|nr:uncharacterized protein EJ05DRAFT_508345 [Pseudovirgaria hyperparasitica]KAF2761148.1 hypothetical protein EJ05DRAFT_508345 [Pseudovirgaria hyperparasitica]
MTSPTPTPAPTSVSVDPRLVGWTQDGSTFISQICNVGSETFAFDGTRASCCAPPNATGTPGCPARTGCAGRTVLQINAGGHVCETGSTCVVNTLIEHFPTDPFEVQATTSMYGCRRTGNEGGKLLYRESPVSAFTATETLSSSSIPVEVPSGSASGEGSSNNTPLIAGVTVGVVIAIATIGAISWLLWRRRRKVNKIGGGEGTMDRKMDYTVHEADNMAERPSELDTGKNTMPESDVVHELPDSVAER